MAMVVKNNLGAVRTLNTLNKNEKARDKSLAKTSSGMKITGAQDDASGYAISERMRVRIRALDQANQNTQNDAALMRTAGGAVDNTVEILRALKEKAINAANDANTDEDRYILQKEAHQLIDQINDNALVQFNGKYLIDGTKNYAVSSTKTILLNQSLTRLDTTAFDPTSVTRLTALADRAGTSLEIHEGDHYYVSWIVNGEAHHESGVVTTGTQLAKIIGSSDSQYILGYGAIAKGAPITDQRSGAVNIQTTIDRYNIVKDVTDKYGQEIYTPDKEPGIVLMNASVGVDTQLQGYTISITDNQGNVNKAATALKYASTPFFTKLWFSDGNPENYPEQEFGKPVQLEFMKPFARVRFIFIYAYPREGILLENKCFKPTTDYDPDET